MGGFCRDARWEVVTPAVLMAFGCGLTWNFGST